MDGYKIIDLGGITLDENMNYNGTIVGTYSAVDISTKPLIITGIKDFKPIFMGLMEKVNDGDGAYHYFGYLGVTESVGALFLTISSEDGIIIEGQ